jgi:tetratricopeptide (TPR) repeat protein
MYLQKALKITPQLALTANNLAWNYAEHGGNLDVALSLAQTARQQAPEESSIADTFGCFYYKKYYYGLAISQFQESLKSQPDNPNIYYKNDYTILVKKALQQALQLRQDFPGA